MFMAFDIQVHAPLVKSAWWWENYTYANQDELDRMTSGRDPFQVAALARKYNVPRSYIMGNVPDRTFMTSDNAKAYDNFLKDLNKLKWIGSDVQELDTTAWNDRASVYGNTTMPLLRGSNGRILPLNQQMLALELERARLDGRLNWDEQRLRQSQQFNKDLGGSQDMGPVSRNFSFDGFKQVYEQEAGREAQEKGLSGDSYNAYVAKRSGELRKADLEMLAKVNGNIAAVRNAHPELAKDVSDALTAGGPGGNILQHVSAGSAGAANGAQSDSLYTRILENLGVDTKDPGFFTDLFVRTAADPFQSFLNMGTQQKINQAVHGKAYTSGDNAMAQSMNTKATGSTGGFYDASGLRTAVDTINAGLTAMAPSQLARMGGAAVGMKPAASAGWFARHPFLTGLFMSAPPAVSPIGNQTTAPDRDANAATFKNSGESTIKKLENGEQLNAEDKFNQHLIDQGSGQVVTGMVNEHIDDPDKKLPVGTHGPGHVRNIGLQQPEATQNTQPAGDNKEWYKNPWLWAAGGGALLGGGLLLNAYLDKRRRREKERKKPARRVAPPRVMPRQTMLPYDYQPEQDMNLGYFGSDNDPFDVLTGDYYY